MIRVWAETVLAVTSKPVPREMEQAVSNQLDIEPNKERLHELENEFQVKMEQANSALQRNRFDGMEGAPRP